MGRTTKMMGYWSIILLALLLCLTACGGREEDAMLDAIFQNELIAVEQDGLLGYANRQGTMVIPAQFEDAAWQFGADGTSYVKTGGLWGFIDKTGKFLIEPQFSAVGGHFDGYGHTYVCAEGVWYFIDKTGAPASGERFDREPIPVGGDRYSVLTPERDRRLVDHAGNLCGEMRFAEVCEYREELGLYVVSDAGRPASSGLGTEFWYGLMDRDGQAVTDIAYRSLDFYPGSNFIVASTGTERGIMAPDGSWILEPQSCLVIPFTATGAEGYLWFGVYAPKYYIDYGIVDPAGKLILEPAAMVPAERSVGDIEVVLVPDPDYPREMYCMQYRFVDKQGNFVNDLAFDYFSPQNNGLYVVGLDGKYGCINEDFEWVVDPIFDSIGSFSHDLAPVSKDGLGGYIDSEGRYAIELQNFSAGEFNLCGYAVVMIDGKYGVIDTSGNIIHPAQDGRVIAVCHDGSALIQRDDRYFLFDGQGELLYDFGEEKVYPVIGQHRAFFRAGEKAYLIDGAGRNWVYDSIQMGHLGSVVVKDGKYGLIDDNGYLMLSPQYSEITLYGKSYAAIAESSYLRVFDCVERTVGRELYSSLSAVGDGQYLVGEREGRHVLVGESARAIYTFPGRLDLDGIQTLQLEKLPEDRSPAAIVVLAIAALVVVLGLTFFLTSRRRRDTIKENEREVTHMTTIQWLGQNGYMLEKDGVKLCIDPYLSDSVFKSSGKKRLTPPPIAPEALACDAMVCTYNHLDHLDPDTISVMATKDTTRFLAPYDCEDKMNQLGVTHYEKFDPGATARVGDFELEAVYADHTSKSAIGVVVRVDGLVLLFTGDTYYNEKLKDYRRFTPDILFICINGKLGNMNVDEAVQLTGEIAPRVGVPTHYGLFAENTEDPAKYTSRVPSHYVMTVGKTITLADIMEGRA